MFSLETERLIITEFTPDMAQAVHENSLDEDNRRFVPDEVFETVEDAAETIDFLASRYGGSDGPFVYPVLLKDGTNIGYVQAVPLGDGIWEIGYHIGAKYTKRGYATEAVKAFLPVIMKMDRTCKNGRYLPCRKHRFAKGDGKVRICFGVQRDRQLSGRTERDLPLLV